jgi:hypothetical protein
MKNNEQKNITSTFDTYTDAELDAMYEEYLLKQGGQELPDTKEWGLY